MVAFKEARSVSEGERPARRRSEQHLLPFARITERLANERRRFEPRHPAVLALADATGFLSFAARTTTHYDGGMEPIVNPYESPAATLPSGSAQTDNLIRNRVRLGLCIPCFAFIALGGLQATAIPWLVMDLYRSGEWPDQWGIYRFILVLWTILLVVSVIIAAAGVQLLRLQSWRFGLVASILCSIPYLSPLYVLGIPFGLWAVSVLLLPSTRAFAMEKLQSLDLRES